MSTATIPLSAPTQADPPVVIPAPTVTTTAPDVVVILGTNTGGTPTAATPPDVVPIDTPDAPPAATAIPVNTPTQSAPPATVPVDIDGSPAPGLVTQAQLTSALAAIVSSVATTYQPLPIKPDGTKMKLDISETNEITADAVE